MTKSVFGLLALVASVAFTSAAQAQFIACDTRLGQRCTHSSGVQIKDVVLAGDGCQQGTDSFVQFDSTGNQIEISFGGFNVTADRTAPVSIKNCAITLNLIIPNGVSANLFQVDYSGFALLPRGSQMQFFRNYRLSGPRTPAQTAVAPLRTITGRNVIGASGIEALTVNWDMPPDNLVISTAQFRTICGDTGAFLTANARIILRNTSTQMAYASVDRAGIKRNTIMHYGFAANTCSR